MKTHVGGELWKIKQIASMRAGDEINLLVVHKIFGHRLFSQKEMRTEAEKVWKEQPSCCVFNMGFTWNGKDFHQHSGCYSTDMEAAWNVVEEMMEKGHDFEAHGYGGGGEFKVCIGNQEVFAKTMPLAICRAALAAMVEEEKK